VSYAVVAFASGLLFACGLGISGMAQPAKVVGFLDVAGEWDPSLAFVMVGAIATHALSYRLIVRRPSPILAIQFDVPMSRAVDASLVAGAALFGIGWGLGGFCPGPALVSVGGATGAALVFVPAMVVGMLLFQFSKPGKQ
jgi:uncharacterized membrane protein YedE/YeeE